MYEASKLIIEVLFLKVCIELVYAV